jgi:hypothetical protein
MRLRYDFSKYTVCGNGVRCMQAVLTKVEAYAIMQAFPTLCVLPDPRHSVVLPQAILVRRADMPCF